MVREILGQIIEKLVFRIRRHLGSPADHFVDFAHPFVPRQPLLKYRLRSVTNKTALGSNVRALARRQLVLLGSSHPDVGYERHTGNQGSAKPGNVDAASSSLRLLSALCASAVRGPVPRVVSSFTHFQLAIPC